MIARGSRVVKWNHELMRTRRRRLLILLAGLAAVALVGAGPAFANTPWWGIYSEVSPTYLPPGGAGEVIVDATDLGDAPVEAGKRHVTVTDELPPGLTATSVTGVTSGSSAPVALTCPTGAPSNPIVCTLASTLNPYELLKLTIGVKVEEPLGTIAFLPDKVSIEGGGAPSASSSQHLTINGEATPFGVQIYELSLYKEDGTASTQAGSHPFQLTTTLVMNQTNSKNNRQPVALPKDFRFDLPPGLVGNPHAVEQCTTVDFFAHEAGKATNLCPPQTAVGAATVTIDEPKTLPGEAVTVPVFNLVPAPGEPARFGFEVHGDVPIVIDTSVRSGGDYGVVASVEDASELAGFLSSQVTFWGVPGDSRHDEARGWECIGGKPCSAPSELELGQTPLLTLPTSCARDPAREPLTSSAEVDSWAVPEDFASPPLSIWSGPLGEPLGLEGCEALPFAPSLEAIPEMHAASTPTGLEVDVHVPQQTTLEAHGLAEADVRETKVTLPRGVELDPSAANGLEACSEEQVGFERKRYEEDSADGRRDPFSPGAPEPLPFSDAEAHCPEASKVALVHIKTPLLSHELEGALYLAEPAPNGEAGRNPFNSLVALYLVAEDPVSGVRAKLAGEGELEESTGRVTTKFSNAPQLPFEELKVELFGGSLAAVTTPSSCGNSTTEASFTAWSNAVQGSQSQLSVTSGPSGGPCPASPLPFALEFEAQSTSTQAGGFTPFMLEIGRPDGDRPLKSISMQLPPGLAAMLASATPCGEPQAADGTCSPESLIGHSITSAGLGSRPYSLPGSVYLTGPFDGAPFGLSSVTPLDVGPFHLGTAVVRATISVNPTTAAATINTSTTRVISETGAVEEFPGLPQMLKGVPSQIKQLEVTVERPEGKPFQFNPTNCTPTATTGTLTGYESAEQAVSSPFQVGGCAALPFAPKLTASAGGQGSKANGTSLDLKIEAPGPGPAGLTQANIAKVDLQLPAALSSRLSTLQQACPESVFDANPAACDEGSVIGSATVHTPVLQSPLSGPAYLVSHGGAAFPDVEYVLQGEGIKIILDGQTDIKNGITYSKFESAPDVPFTLFETELPAGPHSALAPNVPEKEDFSLCNTRLVMPTTITGQNGDVIEQGTNIAVTGCSGVLPEKVIQPTRTQLLAKALSACKKKYKKNRHKRLACEKQARKRYGAKRTTHKSMKTASREKRS